MSSSLPNQIPSGILTTVTACGSVFDLLQVQGKLNWI